MQEVKIFEGNEVEVLEVNGQVLFNPKHVAECLDIADVNSSIRNFNHKQVVKVKNSDVHDLHIRKLNNAGENFLTESGVYKLVFKSHKPNAKQFTDWIADEVLPSIRESGGYIGDSNKMVNYFFDGIPEQQKTIILGLFQSIEIQQKEKAALKNKNEILNRENDLLSQKVLEWADRPLINALVRSYGHSMGGDYSKAWTDFKKELLYRHSINLNARITNYLNETGKKTKPKTLDMLDDSELQEALSTATALCRENNVDISDIISNKVNC